MRSSLTARIEEAVLGTILLSPSRYFDITDTLRPFMFSQERDTVASVIWECIDQDGTVDAPTVAVICEKKHQLNQARILSLPSKANLDSLIRHAHEIKEEYLREQEMILAQKTLDKLKAGELVESVMNEIDSEREMLNEFTSDQNDSRHKQCLDFIGAIHEARQKKGLVGVPTGYPKLDAVSGGWQKGDLNIIAARTGLGKTTILLEFALAAIMASIPVLIYSLEMGFSQVLAKLIQKRTGIDRNLMRNGKIDDNDVKNIQKAVEWFHDKPLFIETSCYTISQIKDKTRLYKKKYGIALVLIDYLQLIGVKSDKYQNKNNEVGEITRSLKLLAGSGDCDLPILCLSQLNRSVEVRGGSKRPQLSDLRDSGNIEQDADSVCFLYRPDYYNIVEDEEGRSLKGIAEFYFAKNRHGALANLLYKFDFRTDSYREHDLNEYQEDEKEVTEPTYSAMIPAAARAKVNDDDEIPF